MRRFFGLFAAFLAAMVLVIAAYGTGDPRTGLGEPMVGQTTNN